MRKTVLLLLTMVALFAPQRVIAQEKQENPLSPDDVVEIGNKVEGLSVDVLASYIEELLEIENPTAYDEKSLELSINTMRDENGIIEGRQADHLLGLLGEANYNDSLISESLEVIENRHETSHSWLTTTDIRVWFALGLLIVTTLFLLVWTISALLGRMFQRRKQTRSYRHRSVKFSAVD